MLPGVAEDSGVGGAEVAYSCGYADQAHFVREFRHFSGSSPGALARVPEVPFVQDAGEFAA